jgi:hypothetical protein
MNLKTQLKFAMNHAAFTGGLMLAILIAYYLFFSVYSAWLTLINTSLLAICVFLFVRKFRDLYFAESAFPYTNGLILGILLFLFSSLVIAFGYMLVFTFDKMLFLDLRNVLEERINNSETNLKQKAEYLVMINNITPSKIGLLVFISFSIFGLFFSTVASVFLMKKKKK